MSLQIGDQAPDFTLKNHNLEDVSLKDFQGKSNVVLLFFPLVNTGVCEKEMCHTRDNMNKYSDLDAQVLAISVDSPFAQQLWEKQNKFGFTFLSDFNKQVAPQYGAFYDTFLPGKLDLAGVAKRSAFVVDKQGKIRYAEVLENPGQEPNYQAIQETLSQLS